MTKEEGGRHTPFFNGYRPQFYFRTTDVTGVTTLPDGVEMVMPGGQCVHGGCFDYAHCLHGKRTALCHSPRAAGQSGPALSAKLLNKGVGNANQPKNPDPLESIMIINYWIAPLWKSSRPQGRLAQGWLGRFLYLR